MRFNFLRSDSPDIPLSLEAIERAVPAAFMCEAHPSRSNRFTAVRTSDVLAALVAEGFAPFYAAQSVTRDPSRRLYTRHILRLRPFGADVAKRVVGGVFPEVVITNANDGTSRYHMMAGLFRLICLNGAVVGAGTVAEVHVRHTGDILGAIIEGAHTVAREFPKLDARVAEWSSIVLDYAARANFARDALRLKYGEVTPPVTVDDVLSLRRRADDAADLWTVFNVVQENLVRGGLRGLNANGRRVTTRGVNGIQQSVSLNRKLWELAEKVAEWSEWWKRGR